MKELLRPRFVIDTSVFTNPESRSFFGLGAKEAVAIFDQVVQENGLEVYMPLSIFREFSTYKACLQIKTRSAPPFQEAVLNDKWL